MTRKVHLEFGWRNDHIVSWLTDHVGPELGQSGLFWWKGAEWLYEFEPFGPTPHKKVSFSDQVSESTVAQFALTFT